MAPMAQQKKAKRLINPTISWFTKKTNNPVVIPACAGMTQKDRVILHELTFVLINSLGLRNHLVRLVLRL